MSCNNKNNTPSIRIGNDIYVTWAIYTGSDKESVPYLLEGKDISIYIKSTIKTYKIKEINVSGNEVSFYFYGKDQKLLGPYSVELVVNEGDKGMFTIDESDAFEIVKRSCEICDDGGSKRAQIKIYTVFGFSIDDNMNLHLVLANGEDSGNLTFSLTDNGQLTLDN